MDRIDDAVREHVASNFRVQIYDMDIRFCRIATWVPGIFLVLFALMSFLSSRKQNQIIETQQLILEQQFNVSEQQQRLLYEPVLNVNPVNEYPVTQWTSPDPDSFYQVIWTLDLGNGGCIRIVVLHPRIYLVNNDMEERLAWPGPSPSVFGDEDTQYKSGSRSRSNQRKMCD